MSNKDHQVLIKIYDEGEMLTQLLRGHDFPSFCNDERTKRAVCMTLINIGELVKLLSDGFRDEHRHIPWRAIAGLRDVTAHRYQSLRMEDIWETVSTDIPALNQSISALLD